MLFLCYPKCSTCKKARKWLDDNQLSYTFRDITLENPSKEELKEWIQGGSTPARKAFNTSGMKYRAMGLAQKLKDMTEDEMLELLATDGMLVKRPVLVHEGGVLFGFRQTQWEEALLK